MEGRPAWFAPVFIIRHDGSWFGISVYTDRTQAMSSATPPKCGHNSLMSIPHSPYFLNWKGDFISSPVRRSVLMVPPGSGWPSYLASAGLGSKLSIEEQPP